MNKKLLINIVVISFFVGAIGSITLGRFVLPGLATVSGFGWVNRFISDAPIVVNRREEVQFTEGVDLSDLVKQAGNITVGIYSDNGSSGPRFAGNGIILSADGLVFTSKSVAANGSHLTVVLNDGTSYDAQARAADPRSDLLVLTIPAKNLPVAQLADARNLRTAQRVIGIGQNNRAQLHNFITGFVAQSENNTPSLERVFLSSAFEETFTLGATITPDYYGGPVLDLNGRVVGIMTQPGAILPTEDLQTAMSSYLAVGKIIRPMIGLKYLSLSEALAKLKHLPQDGALVIGFEPNSPAQKAGVLPNDFVVSINGQTIDQNNSFEYLLNRQAIAPMKFGLLRNGNQIELTVNPYASN